MKKISFWIVIFICMADALWQSRKRVGCFICLKIRQRNTKTAQYRKGLFSKSFWTILMMLIKIRIIRNLISVLLADHITVRIPNWGWDWWRRGFIVPIEMTCFFLRQCVFIRRCFTVGFYMLGIRGTHIFPQDKYRLDYTLYFYSFPSKFWE